MHRLEKELKILWEELGRCGHNKFWEYYRDKKPFGEISRNTIRKYIAKFRDADEIKIYPNIDDSKLFLKNLEVEKSIKDLTLIYNVNASEVLGKINSLKVAGFNIIPINNKFKLEKHVIPEVNIHTNDWDGETIIKFGAIGDNHLCSKWQQLTFLHHLYDLYEKEGVEVVYNAGDVSDGYYKNRPGHIYELVDGKIGFDDQSDYIIANYPKRKNIITKFITGNHDNTHIMNGGACLGKKLDRERKDLVYLGNSEATVELTPNCKMELIHPIDQTAYAISYSPQKYIDSLSGGEKPNIVLMGHYHKAMYFCYRNVHLIQVGTTCGQTPFMRGKKIAAHVGGWIVTIHVDKEGTITRFLAEFIPLYHTKQNDY